MSNHTVQLVYVDRTSFQVDADDTAEAHRKAINIAETNGFEEVLGVHVYDETGKHVKYFNGDQS